MKRGACNDHSPTARRHRRSGACATRLRAGLARQADPHHRPLPARPVDRHFSARDGRPAHQGAGPAGHRGEPSGRRRQHRRRRGGQGGTRRYTLLMVTISTHGIAPAIYPKLPYDAQKDFAPIANIGLTPQVLMASLKSGITSVPELIAKAKAGADLNYGSSGNGSASHLAVEMLKSAAGIKLTHVPFKAMP